MKKLIVMLAVLAFAVVSADAAPINYSNTRPLTIGNTVDGPEAILGGALPELQNLLNYLEPTAGFNAFSSQSSVGYWMLSNPGAVTVAAMKIEITANLGTQQLGIFSDTNGDTDALGRTLVDIFNGPATGITNGGQTNALLFFRPDGKLEITGGAGVNVGIFDGISQGGFGFYLQPTGDNGQTWYSLDQLNNGSAQMMAYFFNAPGGPARWTIGFEDVVRGSGDNDYQDLMFQIESIQAVPEPATMLLLGAGLLGLAAYGRKRLV
jgi:hypothetical protein